MRKLVLAVLAISAAPFAWGHAVLLQATPQAGASVSGPVIPVSLRFNSRIDGRRSRLAVVRNGKEEALAFLPQSSPDTLAAQIEHAVSGPCKVRWQVLASDGHISRGELLFQVK